MPVEPMNNAPMVVEIYAGEAARVALSISALTFDANGNMVAVLSDGTELPAVPCASMLAASQGGKYIVVADDGGNLFANGKKIGGAP